MCKRYILAIALLVLTSGAFFAQETSGSASATGAVGGTVNEVTKSVGGIRISQSTDASVSGGSTLSLTGDNLHLEKGTAFGLRLNQSTSVGNDY